MAIAEWPTEHNGEKRSGRLCALYWPDAGAHKVEAKKNEHQCGRQDPSKPATSLAKGCNHIKQTRQPLTTGGRSSGSRWQRQAYPCLTCHLCETVPLCQQLAEQWASLVSVPPPRQPVNELYRVSSPGLLDLLKRNRRHAEQTLKQEGFG